MPFSSDDDRGVGNCGDGIDNDKEVKPTIDDQIVMQARSLEGYDPSRTEANRDNDPPGGRP